jgi:hypothetical protein
VVRGSAPLVCSICLDIASAEAIIESVPSEVAHESSFKQYFYCDRSAE